VEIKPDFFVNAHSGGCFSHQVWLAHDEEQDGFMEVPSEELTVKLVITTRPTNLISYSM
jgi:hypothetical protein